MPAIRTPVTFDQVSRKVLEDLTPVLAKLIQENVISDRYTEARIQSEVDLMFLKKRARRDFYYVEEWGICLTGMKVNIEGSNVQLHETRTEWVFGARHEHPAKDAVILGWWEEYDLYFQPQDQLPPTLVARHGAADKYETFNPSLGSVSLENPEYLPPALHQAYLRATMLGYQHWMTQRFARLRAV